MGDTTFELDGESVVTQAGIAALAGRHDATDDGLARAAAEIRTVNVLDRFVRTMRDTTRRTDAFASMTFELHAIKASVDPQVWAALVCVVKAHPACAVARLDPLVRRSAEKPRGYSGDAVMLDFLYRHPDIRPQVDDACPVGRDIHAYTHASHAADAVLQRRAIIASLVDRVASSRPDGAEILTIAAGHLREAEIARSLADGKIRRWVALDQDPASVEGMRAHVDEAVVEPFLGSVKGILGEAYGLGTFDLVYAAGIYDYLPEPVAVRLTLKCLSMLKPGGTFMFANFAPGVVDDALMETFMDWSLILRDVRDMERVLDLGTDGIACETKVEAGIHDCVLYGTAKLAD